MRDFSMDRKEVLNALLSGREKVIPYFLKCTHFKKWKTYTVPVRKEFLRQDEKTFSL